MSDAIFYLVTGVDCNGRRFRKQSLSQSYIWAINAWRGSYWVVTNGKRKLSHRVWN